MSDSKLIAFFNDARNFTEFERRKKIYELTNNLDIDLLYDLIDEYKTYSSSLLQKIKLENGIEIPDVYIRGHLSGVRKTDIVERRNIYIDTHLKDNTQTDNKEVEIESKKFLGIIYDLLRRKISDLPKNSRQRNNSMYYLYEEEIDDDLDWYSNFNNDELQQSNELIDLSDTSIVGKIIYLEKLGIIDYLRSQKPFNTSVNSIATVISAVTGAKATSIQPMLNPLLGKDVDSKNNPLNSKKNVYAIENILLNIGFEFNKKK